MDTPTPTEGADPSATTSATAQQVRPPPGLARGRLPVPAWIVVVAAAGLLVATVAYFVMRHRRLVRRRRYQSVAPASSKR